MKASLLLLLFTIISLSGEAGPNLRFLRSIPNRIPRIPISPVAPEALIKSDLPKDTTAIEETDITPIIPLPQYPKGAIPSVFSSAELKIIFNYFK